MSDERSRLIAILLSRSFKLGDFTLSSGKKSEYYVDCRTSTLHPEGLKLIVEAMLPVLRGWGAQAAGGLTLGADPLAAGVALGTAGLPEAERIPGFIVRKEAKPHGLGRLEPLANLNELPQVLPLDEVHHQILALAGDDEMVAHARQIGMTQLKEQGGLHLELLHGRR